ncbi:MAG: hypothetical protein Q9213_007066 [Squamulea squamosa]
MAPDPGVPSSRRPEPPNRMPREIGEVVALRSDDRERSYDQKQAEYLGLAESLTASSSAQSDAAHVPTTHRASKAKKEKKLYMCNDPGCTKQSTTIMTNPQAEKSNFFGQVIVCRAGESLRSINSLLEVLQDIFKPLAQRTHFISSHLKALIGYVGFQQRAATSGQIDDNMCETYDSGYGSKHTSYSRPRQIFDLSQSNNLDENQSMDFSPWNDRDICTTDQLNHLGEPKALGSTMEPINGLVSYPFEPALTEVPLQACEDSEVRQLVTHMTSQPSERHPPQRHVDKFHNIGQEENPVHGHPPRVSNVYGRAEAEGSTERTPSSTSRSKYSSNGSNEYESDTSHSPSPESDSALVLLHLKHELMVRLMLEVYTIFDQRCSANTQTHAGATPSTSPGSSHLSTAHRIGRGRKRDRDDRDATPSPNRSKRIRENNKPSSEPADGRLFACPFHKYDRSRYCCSFVDGRKYRACVGPGFNNIARLK